MRLRGRGLAVDSGISGSIVPNTFASMLLTTEGGNVHEGAVHYADGCVRGLGD